MNNTIILSAKPAKYDHGRDQNLNLNLELLWLCNKIVLDFIILTMSLRLWYIESRFTLRLELSSRF